jgi:Na+/H+-dicarboxylate symporter
VFSIITARLFNLNANQLIEYKESASRPADVAAALLNLAPDNIFAAVSSNSVLPAVFMAVLIGAASL